MVSAATTCRLACTAVVAVLVVASMPLASAQQQPPRPREPAAQVQMRVEANARPAPRGQDRSLSDAVRHVQRTTGGHILGAERVPYDGGSINRVKYMDERGRVRYMDDPVQRERSQPRTPRSDMSSLRGDNP